MYHHQIINKKIDHRYMRDAAWTFVLLVLHGSHRSVNATKTIDNNKSQLSLGLLCHARAKDAFADVTGPVVEHMVMLGRNLGAVGKQQLAAA